MLRCLAGVLLLVVVPVWSAELPRVVVLATGGTIAGTGETTTGAAYQSGELSARALLAAVPQLGTLARLQTEQISNIGSQDMSQRVWLKLAQRINSLLADDAIAGVVVTHGTDTLEETAYFLQLVVSSDKPVVLTAAMRPATALSADGPLNLFNAVAVAADARSKGRGVLVVANDDVHGARAVRKTHTTDLQTFSSGEPGLIGTVLYGEPRFYRTAYRKHTGDSQFAGKLVQALPRVDVIYVQAGFSADLIDAAVAAGARGLVTAGVGNGNLNAAGLAAIARATEAGVAVVRASRVTGGVVGRNIEANDDALGSIAAGDLTPGKARILLQLALLAAADAEQLQDLFYQY